MPDIPIPQYPGECALDVAFKNDCLPNEIKEEIFEKVGDDKPIDQILIEVKQKTDCETDLCAIRAIDPMLAYKAKLYYKVEGPHVPTPMNNLEVDGVLAQHKGNILHVPVHMMDFLEPSYSSILPPSGVKNISLATLNLANVKADYFFCVLNTDVSSRGGEHWICLFANLQVEPIVLEYFDSMGRNIPGPLNRWCNMQINNFSQIGKKCKLFQVTKFTQLQFLDTECGVFCLFYIDSRLRGIPAEKFSTGRQITDEDMHKYRKQILLKG